MKNSKAKKYSAIFIDPPRIKNQRNNKHDNGTHLYDPISPEYSVLCELQHINASLQQRLTAPSNATLSL